MALHSWTELWQLRHSRWVLVCEDCDGVLLTTGVETKHFIYFYLGHCAILLFKTQ